MLLQIPQNSILKALLGLAGGIVELTASRGSLLHHEPFPDGVSLPHAEPELGGLSPEQLQGMRSS